MKSLQFKRSLTSDIDGNYILLQGQLGIEMPSDKNTEQSSFKIKIGDGKSMWKDLPYTFE